VTNDIPNASPRGRAPARRQKSISPADYVLTFTPEGDGRLPAKAVELLLAVAQRAKIPERSRGEFSRHFGLIIDEANRTPIGRRRIRGKEINLAFDRITNSVQRLHALQWAITQNNLGNTLRQLGERESSTETLQQAVEAFREALKEFTMEGAPYWHNLAQQNLERADTLLAQRRGNK
jgi:tetratricopeptide (TPR) repeat protein